MVKTKSDKFILLVYNIINNIKRGDYLNVDDEEKIRENNLKKMKDISSYKNGYGLDQVNTKFTQPKRPDYWKKVNKNKSE